MSAPRAGVQTLHRSFGNRRRQWLIALRQSATSSPARAAQVPRIPIQPRVTPTPRWRPWRYLGWGWRHGGRHFFPGIAAGVGLGLPSGRGPYFYGDDYVVRNGWTWVNICYPYY
jgi:hypothetical protein